MSMRTSGSSARVLLGGMLAAVIIALPVHAGAKTRIIQPLLATTHAPGASGTAKLIMKSASNGRFSVKGRHLAAGKSFDVVVNNVKVGTLSTGPGGGGIARFSTSPKGRNALLGFDPRGARIEVRESDSGDDDLDSDMPDNQPDSAVACCLGEHDGNDDDQGDEQGQTECEDDMTAAECQAQGGTPMTSTSCLPNPCATTPPPPSTVCCIAHSATGAFVDDDAEVECEDDATECAAHGGTVVQATSCDPNPCQPAPPPDLVICCVPDDGESECERVTADHCTTAGGTTSTATSCDADPCGTGNGGGDGGGGSGGGDDGGSGN